MSVCVCARNASVRTFRLYVICDIRVLPSIPWSDEKCFRYTSLIKWNDNRFEMCRWITFERWSVVPTSRNHLFSVLLLNMFNRSPLNHTIIKYSNKFILTIALVWACLITCIPDLSVCVCVCVDRCGRIHRAVVIVTAPLWNYVRSTNS